MQQTNQNEMTLNGHHLKRRDFLRTAGGGSLALLALNWPSWAVAAEAGEQPELSLDGAGLAFRGGQPQLTLLLDAGAAPVVLTPLGSVVVKESKRETPAGPASARTFSWSDPRGFQFSWTVSRLEKRPGVTVQMHFTNDSKKPVRLREFGLLKTDAAGFSVEGKLADWFLSTLDSHDSVVGGFRPSATLAPARKHNFLDTMTLYAADGAKGLFMGVTGPAVSDVRFHGRVKDAGLDLAIISEMNDVLVDPGETRCSEEVLLLAEPFDTAAPAWFQWVAATHGSRTARGPLSGWCSWYSRGRNIDAKFIGDVCAKVKADRDRLPLDVMQIDDGWQKAYGDWEANPAKFPDGMKVVADQIRAAGAIPGIWLCPNRSSKKGAHPDGMKNEYLDVSHPKVRDFIRKALRDRVDEGFRYFKLDFLWIRGNTLKNRHDQKKTRLELSRDVFALYREAIGEESYLLACVGGLNRGCFGFADAARIGTDTNPNLKRLYKGVCLADCINATGSTAWANGILFANDPDVTYLNLSRSELIRVWYGYVGLLGGSVLTSEPLHDLGDEELRNFETLIPPAPDMGRAFDGQTDPWHPRFGFVAQRSWGNFAAIQLWNPTGRPAAVTLAGIPLTELGKQFHAWSFWDQRYLGAVDASLVLPDVPAYGGKVLRLTPVANDRPVLIGSNLHISMGSAEIKNIVSSRDGMTIDLTDAGAREGELHVFSTAPLRLVSASGCEASIESAAENVWRLKVSQRKRGAAQNIQLSAS